MTELSDARRRLLEQRLGRARPEGHEALYRHVYDEMKGIRRQLRRRLLLGRHILRRHPDSP